MPAFVAAIIGSTRGYRSQISSSARESPINSWAWGACRRKNLSITLVLDFHFFKHIEFTSWLGMSTFKRNGQQTYLGAKRRVVHNNRFGLQTDFSGGQDVGYRNLLAIDSPPEDHESDNLTEGPALPAGWDGDAWKREKKDSNSYWLRAWNKKTGQYAIAQASTYEAARQLLQKRIAAGGTGKATITVSDNKPK